MRRFWLVASVILALLFALLALYGCFRYASIGVDMDSENPRGFLYATHYRLVWVGNGTLKIGGSTSRYSLKDKTLTPFDIGGTFGGTPRDAIPHILGFGYASARWGEVLPQTKPNDTPWQLWSSWVCIPAFLPPLLFALYPLSVWRKRRISMCGMPSSS